MAKLKIKPGRLLKTCVFVLVWLVLGRVSQFALSASRAAEGDWPMYQHDPAHSGRTAATVLNTGPLYLQWAFALGERVEVEAQPVILDGVVYQGVMNGEMHAIDANTGTSRWVAQPGGPIPHTAAVYEGRVYFGSLDGNVYALSTVDGSTDWQFHTGGPVVSAPAAVNGRVYIGSNDGNLYALNAATGAELWRVTTGGPVVSSPAVANGRVYFGSEDLTARCVNADSGAGIWSTPLYGAGMHNTHPVVSDDGSVVIFITVKGGGSSYVHNEGYPNAAQSANPIETWNTYYKAHPAYRYLYYLDALSGADLWDPAALRYVPMPIPYWGLLHPVLAPDGSAWFPAPAGTDGMAYTLDHDDRLFRVDLATGVTTQVAGGSMAEFQLREDEAGRHIFSGSDYYYTISEDVGVYRPASGARRALFTNGDPTGYNFGTHMHPHSPLPSRHLWRYGGAVAMGGVPGASPPIVANNMVYFNSYGWLYAVGPTNRGYNPATSFPARDARLHELTYPRSQTITYAAARDELARRVAGVVARGPENLPITARWEQCGDRMSSNEFTFEVYGFEADWVRTLAEAYPYLQPDEKTQLRAFLSTVVTNTLLNPDYYADRVRCIRFGEGAIYSGETDCSASGRLVARWSDSNRNLIALRLYALWTYADATGDWNAIEAHWPLVTQQFQLFLNAYDSQLGFCNFEEWRVGRLNIGAQIGAAQAVRDMADRLGHTTTRSQAATLLNNLLDSRVALASFVPHLYDIGQRQPALIRLNPDGTIVYEDIMGPGSPYNHDMIPYNAAERNRDTDPSQVNWWNGSTYRVDAGIGFMYYPALSGYFPLSSELAARLRQDLLDKTHYYVNSYEVNNPWWWMADLAHSTTGSGEHLYHSPTLSWTMFQVKAGVLQEDWSTLARQLPEPVSFNYDYDLYRLENLAALLKSHGPSFADDAYKKIEVAHAWCGDTVTYTVFMVGSGHSMMLVDPVPAGLAYVTDSVRMDPPVGVLMIDPNQISWAGAVTIGTPLQVIFQAQVETTAPMVLENVAYLQFENDPETYSLRAWLSINIYDIYLPLILKKP